jgi:hypothetical protein
MVKQASHGDPTTVSGSRQKLARKLEKARAAQQKSERKVGKLRAQLEAAESKLAKRTQRVGALQARKDGNRPAHAPKKRAKTRQTEHERLAALGMVESMENAHAADATPAVVADGAASTEASADAGDTSAAERDKPAPPRTGHARKADTPHGQPAI